MGDLGISRNYLVPKMSAEVAVLWKHRRMEELRLTIKAAEEDLKRFESDIEGMKLRLEHMDKVERMDKTIHIKRMEEDLKFLKQQEIDNSNLLIEEVN